MGIWEDFTGWFTGHDAKESDVYENPDKVEEVMSRIKTISTADVNNAKSEIVAAINELNSVPGVAEYVGTVQVGSFETVFDGISESVNQIGSLMQSKVDDINAYNQAKENDPLGVFLGTLGMAGAKVGEGLLSVGEDLGDGVASVIGWVGGLAGNTDLQNNMAEFIKNDWSHDAFNFYYDSDWAKMSAITEDSGAAGLCKVAGSTAGYLFVGGAAAGWYGISTTSAATLVAGVGGLGTGTESGLKLGKTFNDAFADGVKQGGTQAALAWGAGKLSEHFQTKKLNSQLDDAKAGLATEQGHLQSADDAFRSAQDDLAEGVAKRSNYNSFKDDIDDFLSGKVSSQRAQESGLTDLANRYKSELATIDDLEQQIASHTSSSGSGLQTIDPDHAQLLDDLNAARTRASSLEQQMNTIVDGWETEGLRIASETPSIAELEALETRATDLFNQRTFAQEAVNVAQSEVDDITTSINNVQGYTDSITQAGQKFGTDPVGTLREATSSLTSQGLVGAGTTLVSSPRNVVQEVESAATTLGGGTAVAYNLASEGSNATADIQFRQNAPSRVVEEKTTGQPNVNYVDQDSISVSGTSTDDNTTNPPDNNNNGNNGNNGGNNYNNGGNGSNTGGNNGGGGGGTVTDYTQQAQEQFRKEDTEKTDTKKDAIVETTPTTTEQTSTDTTQTQQTDQTTQTDQTAQTTQTDQTAQTEQTGDTGQSATPAQSGDVLSGNGTSYDAQHTGGGYSESGGYVSNYEDGIEEPTPELEDLVDDASTSIEDIIKGSKYTKIPTSSVPITASSSKSTGNAFIPIAAGLSAAAAAGIGAKAYMDRKHNNDNGEDDNFDSEEWDGDEETDFSYDDSKDQNVYLDDDDNYEYQAVEEEKYGARNNEELADLQ